MPKDRPDFISVRIADAVLKHLGDDAEVRVTNARMHYQFRGAEPVEVLRRPEWQMLQHDTFLGAPLFQEAEAGANALAEALLADLASPNPYRNTTNEALTDGIRAAE